MYYLLFFREEKLIYWHPHSGLVVFYLLYISWVTVYFSLPANTKFPGQVKTLHLCSVIQSCILFALAFALLGTAPTFGLTPECNHNAVVVLFRPFAVLDAGRILFLVLTALVLIIYGGIIYKDWKASIKRLGVRVAERLRKKRPDEETEITIHHNAQTATDPESRRTRTEDVDNSASVTPTYGYCRPKDKKASVSVISFTGRVIIAFSLYRRRILPTSTRNLSQISSSCSYCGVWQ